MPLGLTDSTDLNLVRSSTKACFNSRTYSDYYSRSFIRLRGYLIYLFIITPVVIRVVVLVLVEAVVMSMSSKRPEQLSMTANIRTHYYDHAYFSFKLVTSSRDSGGISIISSRDSGGISIISSRDSGSISIISSRDSVGISSSSSSRDI